ALRSLRISLRHLRAGRKHPRGHPAGRQSVRGTTGARLSQSAAEDQRGDVPVCGSRRRARQASVPMPAANLSRAYTNPEGQDLNACIICGFCERFGCAMGARAAPQTTVLPALLRNPNFELRSQAQVTRILLDSTGKRAVGVSYLDAEGRTLEQR